MQYMRMDGKRTGAALAATLCLVIPAQKPVSHWLVHHAERLKQPANGEPPAPQAASGDSKPEPLSPGEVTPGLAATERAGALGHDLSGVAAALTAYRAGNLAAGDAALTTRDPLARAAVEFLALRAHPAEAG